MSWFPVSVFVAASVFCYVLLWAFLLWAVIVAGYLLIPLDFSLEGYDTGGIGFERKADMRSRRTCSLAGKLQEQVQTWYDLGPIWVSRWKEVKW